MRAEVLQRQLVLLGLAAKQDLDHDGRVQRDGHVGGRHSGQVRLTTRSNEVVGEKAAAASLSPQVPARKVSGSWRRVGAEKC
jgi:hypothetical protein